MIRSVLNINFFGYISRVSVGSQSVFSVLRNLKKEALMTLASPFSWRVGERKEKRAVH